MGDYPLEDFGGRTPLEMAETPCMDRLACEGTVGLVQTIPSGMTPGSDIANLNILGYDVGKYYTGRAPLEAASRGIKLSDDEVAFRCNLVTVTDGVMVDYSAGHITNDEAAELIAAVGDAFAGPSFTFHAGVSYRHLLIARPEVAGRWDSTLVCTPPHDIVGQSADEHLPRGEDADVFRKLMHDSVEILSNHPVNRARQQSGKRPANMIWLWGQGRRPSMPTFPSLYGISGSVISAVDLIRGIGKYAGLSVVEVPGATGYFDTNYAGKAAYGLTALEHADFLFLHVEAPDEAGHVGDVKEKVRAIENFDKCIVGPVVKGMAQMGPYRVIVLPDHLTPIKIRTHVADPVPFVVSGTGVRTGNSRAFSEAEARNSGIVFENGFEFLPRYLGKERLERNP